MAEAPAVETPIIPASPAASAPIAAPAAPAPDTSSAAAPAPAAPVTPVEATAAPAVDAPVQPERSLLSTMLDASKPPAEAAAAAEPAKPGQTEQKEATPAAAAPEPIAWEYSIPETVPLNEDGTLQAKINFDDEARTRVNSMLEAFSTNPRNKENQQALVDFHIERLRDQNRQIADFNRNFWNDTRKGWREDWAKDPEIGGSGIETSKAAMKRVMDIALRHNDTSPANKAFHQQLETMFETTGAGDHPAFGKLLARLARFMDESPPPPPNLNPPKDIGRAPRTGRTRLQYRDM